MTTQYGMPGSRDGRTTTPRDIIASTNPRARYGRGVIDATYTYDGGAVTGREKELMAGTPMAFITATKVWAPCKRTRVNGSGTLTALVVDSARFFQVGDTITVGADTDVAITAIDYDTNTLTIASTTVVDGEQVYCDVAAQAGIETCRGFLNQFVDFMDRDDNTARDRFTGRILIAGMVTASMILGDLDVLRNPGANDGTHYIDEIQFDDEQGQ